MTDDLPEHTPTVPQPPPTPALSEAEGPPSTQPGRRRRMPRWLARQWADPAGRWLLVALAGLGLASLCLLGLGLRLATRPGSSILGQRPTATPALTATPLVNEVLISSGSVAVPLAVPQILRGAGQAFEVAALSVGADGTWSVPGGVEGVAYWVYGTLVNYSFGIPDSASAQAWINNVKAGESLEVQMSDGRVLRFQVLGVTNVPTDQGDVFAQTHGGLTVVVVGGSGATRPMVSAAFLGQSETDVAEPAALGPVDMGVPAQAGDLVVTVVATRFVTQDAPELPPTYAYFLVDYQITNKGSAPVEGSLVQTDLMDGGGLRYSPAFPISPITTYPPLSGALGTGGTTFATAAYLVPQTLAGPRLTWRLTPFPGSPVSATVLLPFGAEETSAPQFSLTLDSAYITGDGEDLVVTGTITNQGEETVTVDETQIGLTGTDDSTSLIVSSVPFLPWTLEPGVALSFACTFTKPLTPDAVFQIVGYEFELNGIP